MSAGLVILLLAGCRPAPTPAPRCAEGEIADGDACVPEACGVGTWGELDVGGAVLVDPAGEGDATTLAEGVALAGGGGRVAVAAGTYAEVMTLRDDGVRIAGRCAALVTIDGSGSGEDDAAVYVAADGVEIDDVTITGGRYGGVWVEGGSATLRGLDVVGNAVIGVFGRGPTTEVTVEDTSVRDTEPAPDGDLGRGFGVAGGARLTAARCTLEGNHDVGIYAESDGTEVALDDVVVRGTRASPDGTGGRGLEAADGATVEATGCTFDGNQDVGVLAADAGTAVRLVDTVVAGTEAGGRGTSGAGILAQLGATVDVEACLVEGNHLAGVGATGEGTVVTLTDTKIRETHATSAAGTGGGVMVQSGAVLVASGCTLERNAAWGVTAEGAGTDVTLDGTTVADTDPDGLAAYSAGVWVRDGARLSAVEARLVGNRGTGAYVVGADVVLVDVAVEGTLTTVDGLFGEGIYAGEGATVSLDGCSLDGNHDAGLLVTGAAVTITDSAVRGTLRDWDGQAAVGVQVQRGGSLTASGLEISGTEGPGLGVADADEVRCEDCVVDDNDYAGAVLWGGTLVLEGCEVSGNLGGAADGGGVGVMALAGDETVPRVLTLRDTTVSDHPYAAVWLAATGVYDVDGNTLEGGPGVLLGGRLTVHGNALYARGLAEGLTLTGNTLSGATDAGVLLDGATATLAENTWSGNGVDLVQQRCADGSALVELDQAAVVELCTGEDRLVDELDLSLYFEEADVRP